MQAEQYGKDLTEAREGGESADKLIPILSLAQQLHAQLASSSPADQAWNQILQKIATETGVAVNDKASALQAIGNLVARQMPDMREELHIRNFAGPEISAIKTMLADPALSDENFNLILNTEMANANVAQNRRDAALDAIRYSQAPKDYYDKEKQVFAPESNPMWNFFKTTPGCAQQERAALRSEAPGRERQTTTTPRKRPIASTQTPKRRKNSSTANMSRCRVRAWPRSHFPTARQQTSRTG